MGGCGTDVNVKTDDGKGGGGRAGNRDGGDGDDRSARRNVVTMPLLDSASTVGWLSETMQAFRRGAEALLGTTDNLCSAAAAQRAAQ